MFIFGGVLVETLLKLVAFLEPMLHSFAVLLIAFPIHELAHGYTAYKLGDPTAKMAGRLTLNPFKHMDLIGTLCLVVFRFGWAKPVPVNSRNFKNERAGMAVVSLAGPLSNFILAFISLICYNLIGNIAISSEVVFWIVKIIYTFFYYGAWLNLSLCIFNLIPIPPLDGEKILAFFLPERIAATLERYSMYFQIALLFLLFTPVVTQPLSFLINNLYNNLDTIVKFILSPIL